MKLTQHSALSTQHFLLVPILALSVLPACKRDSDPPPVAVSEAGLAVVPVQPLEGLPDKAIIGPAASVEESARPAASGGEGGVAVDLSSAEAAANSYAAVLNAGQIAQIPSLLVPEQQEVATRLAAAFAPVAEAVAEFKRVLSEKFPDAADTNQEFGFATPWATGVTVESVEASPDNPDAATATMAGPGGGTKFLTLRNVDGQWRIEDPQLPPAEGVDQTASMLESLAVALRDLTARLDSGEVSTPDQLGPEMLKIMQSTTQGPGGALPEAAPESAEPSSQGAAPQPRERQRDAVDDVVSGPFLNRGN